MSNRNRNRQNNNVGGNNNIHIPEEVKAFAFWTRETYHKKVKGTFSKKEEKEYFWQDKMVTLSEAIIYLARYGNRHDPKIQEIKNKSFEQFCDRDQKLPKKIIKELKKGEDCVIENAEYLPILLHEMLTEIAKFNANLPEGEVAVPTENLMEICDIILKKKMKKLVKKGIPENFAFDLLMVMPEKDALQYGKWGRAKLIFDLMYLYAANNIEVDVATIMKAIVSHDDYEIIISYALQERKEKSKGFNENQMKVWVDINEWLFNELEDMDDDLIYNIINNYIRFRKRDAQEGKDSNRRYFLNSLPQSEYPNVTKVLNRIKSKDNEAEKYL